MDSQISSKASQTIIEEATEVVEKVDEVAEEVTISSSFKISVEMVIIATIIKKELVYSCTQMRINAFRKL